MPSSVSFIGSGFYVASATQVAAGSVRVKYSTTPKAVSNLGVNDALNPVNYTLSGPGPYVIASIQPVSGDPLSFDIVFVSALVVGTWVVQVANVQTPASNPLTAPTAAQFQVTSSASLTSLSGGAENDDPETIIRKHLSPALKGPNWDALIKALSVGDDINWDNARAAFDQLFITTASGSYLERKAGDNGLLKPPNVGIDDELFRKLAVKTNANKVVHEAIREILEVYYGQDSLRAFVECELDEKYNLSGNVLNLSWTLDEKEDFTHTFVATEFGAPTSAKAVEVAFALTKVMKDAGSKGFASVFLSPLTGKNRVRIYSGSLGLGSFVRVTGGTAQNVFRFPTLLSTYSGTVSGYSWTYTHPDANTTRASLTFTSPLIDISGVQEGDYVVMGSDAGTGITGSFAIKAVSTIWNTATNVTQTFDIEAISFTGSAIQASNSGYTFYRPIRNSIAASNGRTVVVAQTRNGQVDISIPATTQVVSRGPGQATYGRVNSTLDIVRLVRNAAGVVTITTATPHGLTTGNQIQLDDVALSPGIPFITPSNGASFPSSFSYAASPLSIVAESQTPPVAIGEDAAVAILTNGQVLFCGGSTRAAGTIISTNGFQSSGAGASIQTAARYVFGSTATITDATEADGATQSTHTWVATSDMNFVREHAAASAFLTGAITTGGMVQVPFSVLNTAEQYQLDGVWLNLPTMASPRCGHQQVTLPSGYVMVIGGAKSEGTALATTEIYDGTSWSAGATMNVPRTDFQVVKLSNGDLMAIGGRKMGEGHLLDAKTLALWRLDEAAGPTAADATSTFPLTYSSPTAPLVTENGKVNRALDFSAATTKLTGTGSATAQNRLLGEWTVEFWHKHSTTDPREFVTYGGATGVAADNILLNVGMSDAGRIFWRWENGVGSAVTQGSTFTWPATSVVNSQQTDPITTHPIWRVDFFNHIALRKSFNSPKTILSASRISNVTTLRFTTAHSYSVSDVVYVASDDSNFSSGPKTVTGTTSTTITYAETAADLAFRWISGTAGKTMDVTLFVNGAQIQQWTNLANASGGPTSGNAWYVAHNPEITSSGCEGFLDDIRVSFKARDADEIRDSFLRGWGHQRSTASVDQAIGAVTDTCEVYNGSTWTPVGRMSIGRAFHRAVVLPGDYVLVHGGLGYDTTQVPPLTNHATVGLWPNNSLNQAELYDPSVKRWFPVRAAGVRRHGHAMYYLPTTGKVIVVGGSSFNQNPLDVDDPGHPELFDVPTASWRTEPVKYRTAAGAIVSALNPDERDVVLYGGFDQTGATNTKALTYIGGSSIVTGPGFNAQHTITATPSSTTFQIETKKTPEAIGYSSSYGPRFVGEDGTWNQGRTGGTWRISLGSRTGSITTLTLTFPTGYTAHDISVGDVVYVNSRTGAFGGGLKTVSAVTTTTISYPEAASDQGSIAVVGSVSESWSPDAGFSRITAVAQTVNDPGPFTFDPQKGLAITATESTVAVAPLYANQNYEEVELDDTAGIGSAFPDETGYIVFSFGTDAQSKPVKYLGRYKASPTTVKLTLDYSYRFTADQVVGARVTLLTQKAPFAPVGVAGSAYVTASSAGRIAAAAAAEEALAAGITPDITIVYPGDRGLGGEGYPSQGAQKLSDKVQIFAGDDITQELQEVREE
jgi:hypothetical protein